MFSWPQLSPPLIVRLFFFFLFLLLMVLVVGDLRMAMKSKAATEV